jgi:hypothetical protein
MPLLYPLLLILALLNGLVFSFPAQAGASAALALSISNCGRTQTVEANGTVNIAAAASPEPTVQNVIPTVLPDDVPIPAGIDGMPYTVNIPEVKSSVQFFHKDDLITKGGQKFARVAIPISLTDEMGRVLDIDKDGFKDGKGHFWHDIPVPDSGTPRLEPITGFNLSDVVGAPAQTTQKGKIKAQRDVTPCEAPDIAIQQALASLVWDAELASTMLDDFFKPSMGEPPATPSNPGFFTLENIARVAVGALPILGGAIDCGTEYYNLFAGREVDLVTAEFGCLGMALDAGTFAAGGLAGRVAVSGLERGFLLAIKAVNGISKAGTGIFHRVLNRTFYKYFVEKAITASEFAEKLRTTFGELMDSFISFGAEKIKLSDNFANGLFNLGCDILSKISRDSLVSPLTATPEECSEDFVTQLLGTVAQAAKAAGIDPADLERSLMRVCCTVDGEGGYIKGAEALINKIKKNPRAGDIKGVKFNADCADALRGLGPQSNPHFTDLEIDRLITVNNQPFTDIDLVAFDNRVGKTRYIEVKNGSLPRTDSTQFQRLKMLAAADGAIFTAMTNSPLDPITLGLYRQEGVDIIDLAGNLLNP